MATVAVAAITRDGTAVTTSTASSGGDKVRAADRTFLLVENGGGSSLTVTIGGVGTTSYGVDNPDKTVSVAAGATSAIPLLAVYGDPDDSGLASITWSATTSVTFAALRI
ncbi:hypothetical protein BJF79_13830 [Actinomadura sp. CNU-125]|uniref:hypothetical protein n=1 Tax=Actinomadura sp. CNU-125 TaxID=1904961 RepID=UPI00095AAC19|nr:hypothetical protein [Actinomadura sp. CNU-125]OLT24417.1 hypothetical protein BJF79_13830 [Actinomadura sp. CNU-125]